MTLAIGIHQSDLIIRSAIIAALTDMRRNPWLIDYVFSNVAQDSLTADEYGELEVKRAKDWFLKNDVKVFLNLNDNGVKMPCISIRLASSNEAEKTHGDINYEPTEDSDGSWPDLTAVFDLTHYDPATGVVTIPQGIADSLFIVDGMIMVTKAGGEFTITEALSATQFVIDKGLSVDLTQASIRGTRPALITSLESVQFSETYEIGCHAHGESIYAIYLHSIVVFALLMYKEALLEERGFERSVLQSSDLVHSQDIVESENSFSRWITLSGYVRQVWPKNISSKIAGVATQLRIADAGKLYRRATIAEIKDAPYVGDEDADFFG